MMVDDMVELISKRPNVSKDQLKELLKKSGMSGQLDTLLENFRNLLQNQKVVSFHESRDMRRLQWVSILYR